MFYDQALGIPFDLLPIALILILHLKNLMAYKKSGKTGLEEEEVESSLPTESSSLIGGGAKINRNSISLMPEDPM